jgi:hypothetical protein
MPTVCSVDLVPGECDALVVVALRGELDVADAVRVVAELRAQHAGGDLLLAAPQQQVRRILAVTRLIDVISVHPTVDEAARCAARMGKP